MQRIGLTGGIAAGKSVAAARFTELGAVVIDYDQLAREVVEPGTVGLAAVVRAFGPGIHGPDGGLDRAALARIVFAQEPARAQLNAIVHPLVHQLAADREARATAANPTAIIVHDIPLLADSGGEWDFDVIVAVLADVEVRVSRLVDDRGLTEEEARARIAAQTTDQRRAGIADVVLDGTGTVAELREQVDEVWHRITAGHANVVAPDREERK